MAALQLHAYVAVRLESEHTAAELKEQCKAAGIRVSGNKKEMALRLTQHELPQAGGASFDAALMSPGASSSAPPTAATAKKAAGGKKRKAPAKALAKAPAKAKAKAPAGAAQKRGKTNPPDDDGAAGAAAVEQIVANIERGDCPWPLERAWLITHRDESLRLSRIEIVVSADRPRLFLGDAEVGIEPVRYTGWDGSLDIQTLKDLKEYGYFTRAGHELGVDLSSHSCVNVELGAAMPETMLALAVEEKWDEDLAKPGEAARLASLYATWLQGVKWGQTFLHDGNRPSSSRWRGSPWDTNFIMEYQDCGLRRGLPPASSSASVPLVTIAVTQKSTPESVVADYAEGASNSPPESFVQIWSSARLKEESRGESLGAAEAMEASVIYTR